MRKVWRARFQWVGYPPTYAGPLSQEEMAELIAGTVANDEGGLFEVTLTRGDFGGEIDRAERSAALYPAGDGDHRDCLLREIELLRRLSRAINYHLDSLRQMQAHLAALKEAQTAASPASALPGEQE